MTQYPNDPLDEDTMHNIDMRRTMNPWWLLTLVPVATLAAWMIAIKLLPPRDDDFPMTGE